MHHDRGVPSAAPSPAIEITSPITDSGVAEGMRTSADQSVDVCCAPDVPAGPVRAAPPPERSSESIQP